MKRNLILMLVIGLLLAPSMAAADTRCNVHLYGNTALTDSAGNATWTFKAKRTVTSDEVHIAKFERVTTSLTFAGAAANYDSCRFSLYGKVSLDGDNYYQVDSSAAIVTSLNADSTYIQKWDLPAAEYFKFSIKGWAENDSSTAASITVKVMKQQ